MQIALKLSGRGVIATVVGYTTADSVYIHDVLSQVYP